MPSLIGSSPMATGRSGRAGPPSLCRRRMIWRVSAIETAPLVASRWSNSGLPRRASTESRTATTVAERGSSVNRLISPTTWPRVISRTVRS